MSEAAPVHATLVATYVCGLWRGALLLGASGAGKSDLALRAIAAGWRLVADDRVCVWTSGGSLYGRAPRPLSGLIEARGLGLVGEPSLAFARLTLVVEAADRTEIERVPDPVHRSIGATGVSAPLVRLDLRDASAVVKLDRALRAAARRAL